MLTQLPHTHGIKIHQPVELAFQQPQPQTQQPIQPTTPTDTSSAF